MQIAREIVLITPNKKENQIFKKISRILKVKIFLDPRITW